MQWHGQLCIELASIGALLQLLMAYCDAILLRCVEYGRQYHSNQGALEVFIWDMT